MALPGDVEMNAVLNIKMITQSPCENFIVGRHACLLSKIPSLPVIRSHDRESEPHKVHQAHQIQSGNNSSTAKSHSIP